MKRNFIIGLALITVIFALSGLFIFRNLDLINEDIRIKDEHESILNMYLGVMYGIRNAQIQLYRHQTGEGRDIDVIADNVIRSQDILMEIRRTFSSRRNDARCNRCHSVKSKLRILDTTLDSRISQLKEGLNLAVRTKDKSVAFALERRAERQGEEIIGIIRELREAALRMEREVTKSRDAAEHHARNSIIVAIVSSVMLSLLIILFVMRSVTGRVVGLVRGIEKASSGDYSSKVEIASADEIGYIAGVFNTMTDNLGKAAAEKEALLQELQELNGSLERRVLEATVELKKMHDTLLRSETLAVAGTLASGVAHELSSPLSTVMNYLSLIRKRVPQEYGVAEYFVVVDRELKRCRTTLTGMLDFVRVPDKEAAPVDINAILRRVLRLVSVREECRNVSIQEDLDPGIPPVISVYGELQQVCVNIIINALQAMPDGGVLHVSSSATADKTMVVIKIADTGPGIARDDIGKIFRPFYTNKKSGTGLGLSISYGIVRSYGGDITVSSDYGKGTVFSIRLPLSAPEAAPDKAKGSQVASSHDGSGVESGSAELTDTTDRGFCR